MDVPTWLLDSDPAIHWQTMVHLGETSKEGIVAERARVATTGWGGRILDVHGADGQWAGGTYFPEHDDQPDQPWTATAFTLQRALRDGRRRWHTEPVEHVESIAGAEVVRERCRDQFVVVNAKLMHVPTGARVQGLRGS